MRADSTYSRVYRIMHWAIALCMLFLLLTIFLRMGWMNKQHMADIIKEFLSTESQVQLDDEQLITLAKKIRKPMWVWHTYAGYVLVGLYSIRLLLPCLGEMKFRNPMDKTINTKEKFQFWTYIVFHICVVISLVTGLLIVWGPDSVHETAEEIHVLSLYYLLTFIVLHFGGILFEELKGNGIVSKIIGGKKS
jgi:cytochrome b561